MIKPLRAWGLTRDQRGLSSLEYGILLVVLCVGALALWSKLGGNLKCQMARAEAEFTGKLSGKDPALLPDVCGPSGALAGVEPPQPTASAAPSTSRSTVSERAPGKPGAPKTGAAWAKDVLKVMCPKDKAFLAQLRANGVSITAYDRIYFEDPYYDGTRWTTKHFEAGGVTSGKKIELIRSRVPSEDAATIYHEGVHTSQASSMAWRDKEYEAYIREDAWRLAHGLGPHSASFRTTDAAGKPITNTAAVKAYVDKNYPGVTVAAASGTAPEQVVGRIASGDVIIERADGSTYTRRPTKGDSYPATAPVTVPKGGIPIDMATLQCP